MYVLMLLCMYVCMYLCIGLRNTRSSARSPEPQHQGVLIPCRLKPLGNILPPPSWHRRARLRRSQTRRAIQTGVCPRRRALQVLSEHHSVNPAFRCILFSLMGRGERWGRDGEAWSSSEQSYNLWKGAKPHKNGGQVPWKKGGRGRGKGPEEKPLFPAYDSLVLSKETAGVSKAMGRQAGAVSPAEDEDDFLVPTVQKALNGARKAEQRYTKLVKDKNRAEQLWAEYLRTAKQAYLRERERHAKAIDHYNKEIAVAREQQRDARLVLRQVAFHEEVDDAMVEEDTGDVWSQMVADWDQERADQDDGILQRALLERVGRSRTPVPSGRAPARSPVPGGPRSATAEEAPSYRPMYNEGSPTLLHARADPYPATSPRMAADIKPDHRTAPPDAAEIPVLGTSPVHPHQKEGEPGRKSVKEMTRTLPERVSPHSDFAERIAGRRNALLPFGVPPGLHGQASPVPPAVTEVLDADSVPEAVPGGNTVSNLPSTE